MEELFSLIIEKAYTLEFKEYENPPRHFFSLKHRRKMKRLFENKGVDYSNNAARQSKKKIPAVAIALAIIVSLLVPAAAAAFFIHGFGFSRQSDHTIAFSTDMDNAPKTIEYVYLPAYLTDGFRVKDHTTGELTATNEYVNGDDFIYIAQYTKPEYLANYNTEGYEIEKAEINGHEGFIVDFIVSRVFVWDNGDYIIEINSTLPSDEILKIAGGME